MYFNCIFFFSLSVYFSVLNWIAVTHWVEWLEQFLNMFKQNEGAPGIIEFIDVELSSSALRMFGCFARSGLTCIGWRRVCSIVATQGHMVDPSYSSHVVFSMPQACRIDILSRKVLIQYEYAHDLKIEPFFMPCLIHIWVFELCIKKANQKDTIVHCNILQQ